MVLGRDGIITAMGTGRRGPDVPPSVARGRGVPRIDLWRIISGIIFVIRNVCGGEMRLRSTGRKSCTFDLIVGVRTGEFNRIFGRWSRRAASQIN